MDQYLNVLSKCALFRDVKSDELLSLLHCLNHRIRDYKADEYIFLAGDQVNYIGIVLSGSLELLKENAAGTRHIMAFLSPGQLFAEGIVCTARRLSPVTVCVKEDTKVMLIPYELITKSCGNACTHHTQLIKNMMMILGEKNFNLNSKMELLMLKGMREKIACFLLNEYRENQAATFQITPNRNELAEYLNVSRTSMCRELSRMKEQKILDYYQNTFRILSLEALKNCLLD